MTDAAHLLVDFLSFIISLLSLWLSSRPATHRLSYGWHRAGTVKTTPTKYIFQIPSPELLSFSRDFYVLDFIQQVHLSALTQLRCCFLLADVQRSWALCSQFSLFGWWQECSFTWLWSVSSTTTTPSRVPSCSSPLVVQCWPILCKYNLDVPPDCC